MGSVVSAGRFDQPRGRAAGIASGAARRRKAEERRLEAERRRLAEQCVAEDTRAATERARQRVEELPKREDLAGLAHAVIADVACKVIAGQIRAESAKDAVAIATAFFNIARLDGGQATTVSSTALTGTERQALIAELRAKIEQRKRAEDGGRPSSQDGLIPSCNPRLDRDRTERDMAVAGPTSEDDG